MPASEPTSEIDQYQSQLTLETGPVDLFRAVFDKLQEPTRVIDLDRSVVLSNLDGGGPDGAYRELIADVRCDEFKSGAGTRCDECLVRASFGDGKEHKREVTGIDANGDRWVLEIQTKPILSEDGEVTHVVETFRDRSREKRLERQLLQSAKLVSIGEVATSIAHEVRNPLAGIRLGLDALDPSVNADPSAKEILADITRDIARLDRVVSDLLNFTKATPRQPERFELRTLLKQVCRYTRKTAEQQSIKVEVKVMPEDLEIWADRNQIHQVLLNLLLNAVQSMPVGGRLQVSGSWHETLNWSADRETKSGYRIRVRDTGCGIPEENVHRLFDPFFTTKPNGTGLGLATSLSIVRKHGGEMRINSTHGEGTTAQVLLPDRSEEG